MLNVLAPTFYKQIHTQIKAVRTTDRLFFLFFIGVRTFASKKITGGAIPKGEVYFYR